jgi:signal transduction histidine kinase
MAELGVMTSSLLHELRQPLFAIKALAEVTAAESSGPVAERMYSLLAQLQHVEELVGHYGGLGRDDVASLVFDLRSPLQRAMAMFGFRSRREQVEITADIGAGALYVRGRETAVRQMALNLVQNAMDAVEGEPTRSVVIQAGGNDDSCWFEVRDSGCGIAPEQVDTVFQPFYTSKAEGRGTGLGLHITRLLAESFGGRLDLASEVGVGTRVRVTLPAARPEGG